jgi:3-oxoacyl-[acyl-carrier-protein] synthase-3
LYGLQVASSFIESGKFTKVLLVNAEKMSAITNYEDRNTCILFGDAGTAVLLEPSNDPEIGVIDIILKADGSGKDFLYMPGGGSLNPASHETVDKKMHYVHQDGQNVFKIAVTAMADISVEILEKNNLKSEDIAYLVPHQANKRIIDATANRMKLSHDKVMLNIHKYGNTTSATIPSCLYEYYHDGKLKKGDKLILSAFGAGYTWGSAYIVWGLEKNG